MSNRFEIYRRRVLEATFIASAATTTVGAGIFLYELAQIRPKEIYETCKEIYPAVDSIALRSCVVNNSVIPESERGVLALSAALLGGGTIFAAGSGALLHLEDLRREKKNPA